MRARVLGCAPSGKIVPKIYDLSLAIEELTMYQNTIPSTTHDGVLKVAAEAETLLQPTAVLISGDDRKTDDEGFRAHGSTLAQGLERHTPFIGDNK